uniref:Uncharacterized protein n=1 Tax=Cannabis sativa TaxID=3483 RepID=A0A803QDZ6_CANSA
MKVMGTHNNYNAVVAVLSLVGLGIGVDVEAIDSTIEKLRPPLHRMQIGGALFGSVLAAAASHCNSPFLQFDSTRQSSLWFFSLAMYCLLMSDIVIL